MQSLTAPPQMASPYTPAGGSNMPASMPQPPKLGTPIPGTTGGMPAKPGLSVFDNPLSQQLQSQPDAPQNPQAQNAAQQTQSYGRGDDSMLVHMTPDEVNSLRGLAQKFGGDLTTNPHTGLPEAGWLGKLLPTILGGIGMAFGIPPVWMGALGAVGGTAITGDLKEGLLAGLGAFGGASLAGAAGVGGALGHVGSSLGLSGSGAAVMHPAATSLAKLPLGEYAAKTAAIQSIAPSMTPLAAAQTAAGVSQQVAQQAVKTGLGGIAQNFGNAAKAGLSGPIGGTLAKIAVPAAVMGVANALPTSSGGVKDQQTGTIDNSYEGPYHIAPQRISYPTVSPITSRDSSEYLYNADSNPAVYNVANQMVQPGGTTPAGTMIHTAVLNPNAKKGQNMYTYVDRPWMVDPNAAQNPQQAMLAQLYPNLYGNMGYAHGGEVHMREGSFVMPARETAEFGKGSTNAGQRALAKLGGIPIHGQGDGTSDDIKANIDGQPARVADGEVHFPPEAVKRIGGGDHKRGTDKLYAMMKKAEISRKRAARGGDGLNVAKGLGAL